MVQDALATTTGVAEESISHIRCVRAFANENIERKKYFTLLSPSPRSLLPFPILIVVFSEGTALA